MKTTLALVLASLLTSSAALADVAPIAPDFVGAAPRLHIDRSLVASPDAMNRIEPLDVLAFNLDSTNLSGGSVAQVDRAARWLLRHPRYKIVLEGHTDRLGVDPYNEQLATRRIQAVRQRLLGWGISSDRIVLITYGETHAIEPMNPEDRRVVMFASDQPTQRIVTAQLEHRGALIATWTERGTQLQLANGLGRPLSPPTGTVSRR